MVAAIVASVSSSETVLLAIRLVLLVIMLGPHSYILYSIFITPTVVLFTSTSIADVPTTDAQRLGFTLIGAALILLALEITLGWAHYQQTHSPPLRPLNLSGQNNLLRASSASGRSTKITRRFCGSRGQCAKPGARLACSYDRGDATPALAGMY